MRWVFLATSVALFLLSLAFNAAFYVGETYDGAELLWIGWAGVPQLQVGWCANPLLLLAWPLLAFGQSERVRRANLRLTGLALVLSLSSFLTLAFGNVSAGPGGPGSFEGFGPAIVLWNAAVLFAFLGARASLRAPLPTEVDPLTE